MTLSQAKPESPAGHGPYRVSRGMRDGVNVHTAALAAGLRTRLLPRQVLQVFTPAGETAAFTHGVPQSSTLAAVTFSQDLRMRRWLLGQAKVPQPRGGTFSVGRDRRTTRQYAQEIGFPVVVKPAQGDSTISVQRGVRNAAELDEAFDELLTPLRERPDHTEAAYGITELRKPGRKKGQETVPPGYQVLVEKELAGRYLRVLVMNSEVVSVVHCPDGPWGQNCTPIDDLADLKRPIAHIVRAVSQAIPGLSVISIDIVVAGDSTENNVSDPVLVVDVSERPWLEVQHRIDPRLADELAHLILGLDLPGLSFTNSQEGIEADTQFEGVVDPEAFVEAVTSYAEPRQLEANLSVTDGALGRVGGALKGPPSEVSETVEFILESGIGSQTAMKATLTQ